MFDLPPLPLESSLNSAKGKGKGKVNWNGKGKGNATGFAATDSGRGGGGDGGAAATRKAAASSMDGDIAEALGHDVIRIDSSSEDDADYEGNGSLPPQFLSLANVDVNSSDFTSLPLELQHEILIDLQEVRHLILSCI